MRPCGSPDWGRSPDLRHWALLERKEEGTEGRHAGHAVDDGGTFRSPFLLPHSPPSCPPTQSMLPAHSCIPALGPWSPFLEMPVRPAFPSRWQSVDFIHTPQLPWDQAKEKG